MNTNTNIIHQLRGLVPPRRLTFVEAVALTELQAGTFLALAGITAPPVPEEIITGLPRVHVELVTRMHSNASGASKWVAGRWFVLLNGKHPHTRRRFSLAHELKHILDSPQARLLYPNLDGLSGAERAEQVADQFAACLLMPRPWLKRAWGHGVQDAQELAGRFEVSPTAMRVRLAALGLVEREAGPRCGDPGEEVAA